MDKNLVYTKTAAGEEATLQRTRVVQRNLRMVLLQVDGQMNVAGLIDKIGNESLVVNALRELEKGGYIGLAMEAPSVWEQSREKLRARIKSRPAADAEPSLPVEPGFSRGGPSVSGAEEPPLTPPVPVEAPPPAAPRVAWSERVKVGGLADRFDGIAWHRIAWGKLVAWCFLLLVVAGVAGWFFFPYGIYRADLEALLSETAGTRVQIGDISASVSPRPALVLSNVRVGEPEVVRVRALRIPGWSLGWLSQGRRQIDKIELVGVEMSADFAGRLARLGRGIAEQRRFELTRMEFRDVTVEAGSLAVNDLSGELFFGGASPGQGVLRLKTPDGGLAIVASPSGEGAAVEIEGIGWKPSESSPFVFNALTLKGLVKPGQADWKQVDLNLFDGNLNGQVSVDWTKGISVVGSGTLKNMHPRKLAAALGVPLEMDGKLAGTLQARGVASEDRSLLDGLDATLDFLVEQGVMRGVDLGEASRRGSGETVRGGLTKFDRLKGRLTVSPRQVGVANLDLDAGLLKATGQLVVERQRPEKAVVGSLTVNINTAATAMRAPVSISGTLPVLNASVTR